MTSGRPVPYAYVCTLCQHRASGHGLADDGDVVEGPYLCGHQGCDCEMSQHTPVLSMSENEFEAHMARLTRLTGGAS